MCNVFKIKGYEHLGELSPDDVLYYDVYASGFNIPATPSVEGLTALAETGETWNLKGLDLFVEWQDVYDVRRKRL